GRRGPYRQASPARARHRHAAPSVGGGRGAPSCPADLRRRSPPGGHGTPTPKPAPRRWRPCRGLGTASTWATPPGSSPSAVARAAPTGPLPRSVCAVRTDPGLGTRDGPEFRLQGIGTENRARGAKLTPWTRIGGSDTLKNA